MSEERKSWRQYSKEQLELAFQTNGSISNDGKALRHLVEALWSQCKIEREDISDLERVNNLSLMIGMATPALLDYAKLLEARAAAELEARDEKST